MQNFDALTVLNRAYRNQGESYDPAKFYDPCHFFPMLLTQVLVSAGHHARLVSTGHGMLEVWSNQYRKWVVMDAELDYHVEKAGIPLNLVEIADEALSGGQQLQIVASPPDPGQEVPSIAHLRLPRLTPDFLVSLFGTVEITEMRNDWMTNHYFAGHPARSEGNSLVLQRPTTRANPPRELAQRMRPKTRTPSDLYWTLNQAELWIKPTTDRLLVKIRTVTPNFDFFEIRLDGAAASRLRGDTYTWRLSPGQNRLSVRPVNLFGVRGLPSFIEVFMDRNTIEAAQPLIGVEQNSSGVFDRWKR